MDPEGSPAPYDPRPSPYLLLLLAGIESLAAGWLVHLWRPELGWLGALAFFLTSAIVIALRTWCGIRFT